MFPEKVPKHTQTHTQCTHTHTRTRTRTRTRIRTRTRTRECTCPPRTIAGQEGKRVLEMQEYPQETQLSVRKRRFVLDLSVFDSSLIEINAELRRSSTAHLLVEELIGARLYTGPMFHVYNTVLRGSGRDRPDFAVSQFKDLCKGNPYSTTM